ncbi:MAG: hypothetical protein KC589_01600 [Nanoarchaeota archaeon]|nr:hypothetical protein [Nanoarchaeota archaeon]
MAYQELILIVFSMIFIAILIFFSGTYVSSSKDELSKIAPQLNYDFPSVFVHSFLQMELDLEDKKKFLDKYEINYVKDLLWINNELAKNLTQVYKFKYFKLNSDIDSNSNDIFYYYNIFSGESLNMKDSLVVDYSLSFSDLPDLKNLISMRDYAYYLLDHNGEYVCIYFKSSGSTSFTDDYSNDYEVQSSVEGFS